MSNTNIAVDKSLRNVSLKTNLAIIGHFQTDVAIYIKPRKLDKKYCVTRPIRCYLASCGGEGGEEQE